MGFGGDNPMGMDVGGGFDGQGEAKSEEKKYKDKNLLPVTIKQILSCDTTDDGSAQIANQTTELVRIVAIALSYMRTTTKIEYRLSDGTGTIEAFSWQSNNEGENNAAPIDDDDAPKENTLVSVVGNIKVYQDKKTFFVMSIRPVTKFNELTHHLLDVMVHHVKGHKGPIPGSNAEKARAQQGVGYGMGMGAAGAQFGTPRAGGFGGAAVKAEVGGDVDTAITNAISATGQGEVGASVDDVMMHLKGSQSTITAEQVRDFVMRGMNEGLLYGTTDDEHFKLVSEC